MAILVDANGLSRVITRQERTRRNPPFSVQMKGRIAIPVFDTPTISPASLIPVAEL